MLQRLFFASGFGLSVFATALAQEQPAGVRVDPVQIEPLVQTQPVLGRFVASQEGPVAARVEGALMAIQVQVGDHVEPGDVLAMIDPSRLAAAEALARARVEAAEAQIEEAQAELALQEQERDRMAQLRGSAAFSKSRFDDAATQMLAAEARIQGGAAELDVARANLEVAVRDLADATITAPYSGAVTMRHVSSGAFLRVGDAVVDLIDDGDLQIEADVPSNRIAGLKPGMPVRASIDRETEFEVIVRAIVPLENPLTRTLAVRFELPDREFDQLLAAGQSVTVEVPLGISRDVATVHKDAVLRKGSGDVVFVAEDDAAGIRPVTLGASVGGRFEVISGLEAGELVVIRGNERLRPGQTIAYEIPGKDAGAVAAPDPGNTADSTSDGAS
ncbi:MAG: efflux RND transporter periplasmic adaptor subunit [Geminicoccaceae bacterium]